MWAHATVMIDSVANRVVDLDYQATFLGKASDTHVTFTDFGVPVHVTPRV